MGSGRLLDAYSKKALAVLLARDEDHVIPRVVPLGGAGEALHHLALCVFRRELAPRDEHRLGDAVVAPREGCDRYRLVFDDGEVQLCAHVGHSPDLRTATHGLERRCDRACSDPLAEGRRERPVEA